MLRPKQPQTHLKLDVCGQSEVHLSATVPKSVVSAICWGPMVLRRGRTLISSHFLNALADGSGGDGAIPVSGQGWDRATRGLHGLRNSVVRATLGAGSHPLPWLAGEAGSEWSIPGESYLPVSAPALGPFWDQAPLGTAFTTAFTGP